MLVMDVDGTLTDGKIYMSANGELMKAFNIKDGYALVHLREYGIEPVIITGRLSEIVKNRCSELKIKEFYQGVENKSFKLRELCEKYLISLNQVAYIGDDLNDMTCIQICGLSACPADAIKIVRDKVDFVCDAKGGDGAVREFVDYILSHFEKDETTTDYEFSEIRYEIQDHE